ncbi:DUF3226 domain-containing protein [Allochromatium vinosum]|uniref:DUF3226 domain-containing protein n=1 Tax=Allochromatium vinosum TaxID=1049 RepID=UPI0019086011|nr:DUF3226 domain-containing protein [Allochromatium vinosum]
MATIQISSKKLLLVEGQDEVSVFNKILRFLSIEDVQVMETGGIDNFKKRFPVICKSPDFQSLTAYGIIQDSDADPNAALNRIKHILKKTDQPVPDSVGISKEVNGLKVGFYLLPGGGRPGMLEDLFLETIKGQEILDCVNDYILNLKEKCPPTSKKGRFGLCCNQAKAKVLGALVATAEPYNRIGLAAQGGYWDFNHPAMEDVMTFLKELYIKDG